LTGVYFDSAYLVKCYLSDPDSEKVRKLFIRAGTVSSSALCLAEVACAAHRGVREKSITESQAADIPLLFASHIRDGIIILIPVSDAILHAVQSFLATLPASTFLRAGDAVHLASAKHEGFAEIWTNDRHMLKAAPHFGLTGRSI
jgi:predicted nucleic acid-binding protein